MLLYNEWNMYCAPNIIPPSPQSTKINQRQACLNADLFSCFATPRRRRGGMSERLRRDEIPEREGLLQRRELQIVCKGPAASGQGKGTRSVANPGERGILPIYLPTTFRSHFAAKFSMQIVNIPTHNVCIPAGIFAAYTFSGPLGIRTRH